MKSRIFVLAILVLALGGCNQERPTAMRKVSSEEYPKHATPEDNIVLSSEPSENVSLEDYWDESRSIKTEAQQIIQRGGDFHCDEAKKMSGLAIRYAEKASKSRNFQEAENLITLANESLSQAADALSFCENRMDIEEAVKSSDPSTSLK